MRSNARKGLGTTGFFTYLAISLTLGCISAGEAAAPRSMIAEMRESAATFISQRVSRPADSISVLVELPYWSGDASEITGFRFDLLSTKPVIGTVPLKVTLTLEDGTVTTVAATARVRIYDMVAVAARRLNRHETIGMDDVRLEQREVTLLTDGYFTKADELVGKRVKRIITAGALVRASDVESIPLIERGSRVIVSIVIGAVTVTSKAKALEDGQLGEMIRVRDLATGKHLMGTVAGERLVVLDKSML